jgi:signal transduction histidine kinase
MSSRLGLNERNVVPLALVLLVLFGIGDYVTDIEITFTLLYLLPVTLAAWFRGRPFGLTVAALATACAVVTALTSPGHASRPWLILWNQTGVFVVFLVIVLALTRLRTYVERERRERTLAVEQLRHAERLNVIGKLAAGVAHEIGTPLNVIAGSAELLQSDRVTIEKRRTLEATILKQTQRISLIIRQLLDFGRRAAASKARVDLNDLVRETATLLLPLVRKRSCTLSVEATEGALPILANGSEIEQVLSNLVLNGLQAMPRGGALRVRTQIEQRTATAGSREAFACAVVEDEGVGIAAADLPRIFDPFFTTKEVGEGTGLGLSVSYGIVQDHGGVLEVSSTPGRGTQFSVLLPLAAST